MKKTLLFVISIFINAMSYAYDFKDGDCYYTITSLSDLTVALTNSGENMEEYADFIRWEYFAPCYGGDFVVPTTAKYAGKEFIVTSIEDRAFDKCKFSKLVMPENILSAGLLNNTGLEIALHFFRPFVLQYGHFRYPQIRYKTEVKIGCFTFRLAESNAPHCTHIQ